MIRAIRDWFRPAATELDLDAESFERWLRAGRIELALFLGLSPEEQETLARIGDEHRLDTARAIGAAVWEPVAEASAEAAPSAVERLAQQATTMAGFSGRRDAAAKVRQQSKDRGRTFMGRKPVGAE